jgi:hypothetical protein
MYSTSYLESAVSHSASSERECERLDSAKSIPFCRAVLKKHWPNVPCHDDIRDTTHRTRIRRCHHCWVPLPTALERRSREETEALTMTVGSGRKCSESSKKADLLGSLVRTLLNSMAWRSSKWFLTWKVSTTKSKRLKYRLVPSDSITGGRASGFLATPTATANQNCKSMQKWPGCRGVDLSPEALERRMGYPEGWSSIDEELLEMPSSPKYRKSSGEQS